MTTKPLLKIDVAVLLPKYSPLMLLVLRWLAAQPSKVYDFAVVADALAQPRFKVELAIRMLQHQRAGFALAVTGPNGERLRPRHAYLPADSDARKAALLPPRGVAPDKDAERRAQKAAKQKAAADARVKREDLAAQKKEAHKKQVEQERVDDFMKRRAERKAANAVMSEQRAADAAARQAKRDESKKAAQDALDRQNKKPAPKKPATTSAVPNG